MRPVNCGIFVLNVKNLFSPGMIWLQQKKKYPEKI
jgi:hypothetical protein